MELILDLLDVPELTAAARLIEPPANFAAVQALLPTREIDDIEVSTSTSTVTRGVASYRAWDAETPIGRRRATITKGKQPLLPMGQKLPVGELESIMLQRARGAQEHGGLVRQIYSDTEANVYAIRARVIRAVGQALSTGTVVLEDENGLNDVVVYAVPESHLDITPDDLFSDPDADIWSFFQTLFELYETDADDGQLPGQFTTSRRVVNALRSNKQVIRAIWGPLATEGAITQAQLNQAFTDQGFPTLQIDDTKVQGQRIIPDDVIVMTPSNPRDLGSTVYGITAEGLELTNSNAVDFFYKDAPGIVAVTLKGGDPVSVWSKGTAVVLPTFDRPELLMTARVL